MRTLHKIVVFIFAATSFLLTSCTKEEKIFFEVSEDTVTVYGYVKDINGKPLKDAEVKIIPTGDVVKTDGDGLYKVSIALGSLPSDAVITLVASHGHHYVPRVGVVSFAELLAGTFSFEDLVTGTISSTAVQKRVKRLDLILAPPAQIEVEVVDKDGNPVSNSIIRVAGDLLVSNYLGITPSEFILSVTSSSPAKITEGIPALPGANVQVFAFPPEGEEGKYSVGVAIAELTEGKDSVKVVLGVERLKILYTSVDSGQFITPNGDIKVVFSKPVTGLGATLRCPNGAGDYQVFVEINGAVATVKPAGAILGNCRLTINSAYGKDGEVLYNVPVTYTFIAYDPAAPRGLACPIPQIALQEYSGVATGITFDQSQKVILFSNFVDTGNLRSFSVGTHSDLIITWDPPVIYGITNYKIYKIKKSDIAVGKVWWQQDTNIVLNFRLSNGKYYATINIASEDLSYTNGVSYAIVPSNINGEDVCSLENAPTLRVQDNIGPGMVTASIFPTTNTTYSEGERNLTIVFSEQITFSDISITSRNFEITELSESIDGNKVKLSVYVKPISVTIPNYPENQDGDKLLILTRSDAQKLWAGEQVFVYNAQGTGININPTKVTAIVEIDQNTAQVWFSNDITGTPPISNFVGGYIVPHSGNNLQAPSGQFQKNTAGEFVLPATGLTVGDKIRVMTFSKQIKVLTVKSVDWNNNKITVVEPLTEIDCNVGTQKICEFRSLNPDIKIDATNVIDTSGNKTRFYSTKTNHNGSFIW
ncbi:MAG: hypothetical protein N2254_05680 [bacterium]|nr:hypothetical protein [bacterium]